MTLIAEVASLVTATTDLLNEVTVSKVALDEAVAAAGASAEQSEIALVETARFCGHSTVPPTTRLNGDPLEKADEWQNDTDNLRYSWSGTAWVALNSSAQKLEARLENPMQGAGVVAYTADAQYPEGSIGREVHKLPAVVNEAAGRADSSASLAASFNAPYPTVADGLANTLGTGATKRFFSVPGTGNTLSTAYRNDGGVATVLGQAPGLSALPKLGIEGSYNLINPNAPVVTGTGLDGSNNYTVVATVKSLAIRVDAGQRIVIANPAEKYTSASGYGAAFFSDLPTSANKVASFNASVLTNTEGKTYLSDTVPAGAKYLVVNTEFQGTLHNWFAAYDTVFKGIVAFSPTVSRIDDSPVVDREGRRQMAVAFAGVEGSENLYSSEALLVGYLQASGIVARNNAAWRYVRVPVTPGRTYAIYTGQNTWLFPVAGSYGVAGADPVAGALATMATTPDAFVRTITVPTGTGITHFYFNVYIKPPGGDIDFISSLIIQEGTVVPVRPLPYVPTQAKVNGLPVKDTQSRTAIVNLAAALNQRTGKYNLVDPALPLTEGRGLDGNSNYGALSTGKALAIPVIAGMPIVISNTLGNYLAYSGNGAAFFSDLPTSSNKVRAFANPLTNADTITTGTGLTYRKDVVPQGAKYLVVNAEFQSVNRNWFAAYDTGLTAVVPFEPAITQVSGLPVVDRDTQIMALENSRLVPRRFAGKKVYYFGDSITQGSTTPPIFASYTRRVTEILQCNGTNYGSSGSKTDRMVGIMTNLAPRDGTAKVHNPDYTDVAAVTIMIGTNDAGSSGNITGSLADIPPQRVQDVPFTTAGGAAIDTPDQYWALFPNTYYGNLALCIEYVKWKNPLTVIYLISATQRPAGVGVVNPPMEAVVVAMTNISRYYALQYFDATHECGLDLKSIDSWSMDKLHPNDALGVPRLGNYVGYRVLHS